MMQQRERERERENMRMKVVMFPWLAHGHTSPFLELAKKLSHQNFDVYIYSTPANLNSIRNRLSKEDNSISIHLMELHLPTDELPSHQHTTNGLPLHRHPTLSKALKTAKPALSNLLTTLQPDLVIADFALPWVRSVAIRHSIPALAFSIFSAAGFSYLFHLAVRRGVDFPFPAIRLEDYEPELLSMVPKLEPGEADPDDSPDEDLLIVLMNSSRVVDGKYMDYVCEMMKWEIAPVGALVQNSSSGGDDEDGLIGWLGRKDGFSSVFVSFGSEYFLKKEEIEEVAYGLEMSNVNFIWVVRAPVGEEIRLEESLPQGFVERVKERGKVVEKWAPQAKILRHSSIGGFVSHCGWNSVLEGIQYGVPIIAMPMHLDQPINAKLVAELGVGVEVARDRSGRLQREEIARVIKDVVNGRKGEILRTRVEEMRESITSTSNQEMEDVVHKLTKLCENNNGASSST